ncbi:von Willebrand factor type A domain protein [Rubripirellula tenax]|uniref:von Willebrand factor type A domain protein n=1 Tax=Rubripirellula tenax TaxID=2528015 RepID=A0A5C6ESS5_9BACT|nr:VWA domain-containing protein [Rubripirellula tenax]TWU50509.1 von Willebrand factor type A domain protein [Rubripirellula tenax]
MTPFNFKNSPQRNGTAAVLVVVTFSVFLIMAAFSIDVAYMQLSRLELRTSADAAAKAGAEALSREGSVDDARTAAKQLASMNLVGGAPLTLQDSDIFFGRSARQSDGSWAFTQGAMPYSGVRVHATQPVSLFFGAITGKENFSTNMHSTACATENEICLVVDRSHSMCFDLTGTDFSYPPAIPTGPDDPIIFPPDPSASRWGYLAEAVDAFVEIVEQRNAAQRIGLVTFGSNITLSTYEGNLTGRTFPATALDVPLGSDFAAVLTAIQNRTNDVMLGGTNLSSGMQMGIDMLVGPTSQSHATKTMVVMTDGKWNTGINPATLAKAANQEGIIVHTITFLDTADQSDMVKVAKFGSGEHYHASDGPSLIAAFEDLAFNLPVTLTD